MSANFFTTMAGPAAIAMLNQLWDKAASVLTTNVFTKNQSVAPVVLVSGATVAVDASLSNSFRLTLGTNATLSNPTNLTDGMLLNFYIQQDGVGARTLAYGSAFTFSSGTAPILSTAANAVNFMSCYYDSASGKLVCGSGGGGSSKVTKSAVSLGTQAAGQTTYAYTTIPGVAARGLMSQLTVTASAPGLFDLVVRGAGSDAGTLWLQAVGVTGLTYSVSLPVYIENDAAGQDFFVGLRNRSGNPITFTLTSLRVEKFA